MGRIIRLQHISKIYWCHAKKMTNQCWTSLLGNSSSKRLTYLIY